MDKLRASGVPVATVVEIGLQGATDLAVVDAAIARGETILTQDLDFRQIFVERSPPVQIVVLRTREPRPIGLHRLIDLMLKTVDVDSPDLAGALIVVGDRGYRVRHR